MNLNDEVPLGHVLYLSRGRVAAASLRALRKALAPARVDPRAVESPETLRAALDSSGWDLVLSEAPLAGLTAPDLLDLCEKRKLPLMLIASDMPQAELVDLMRRGLRGVVEPGDRPRLIELLREELATPPAASTHTIDPNLREALDSIQDALVSISLQDRSLVYISANFEQVYGFPIDKLLNDPDFFKQVVHPDDLDLVVEMRDRCLSKGYAEFDHRILHPDGSVHWLHRRASINFDAQGRPIRVNDSALDITARKEAEQAVRESEQRLKTVLGNVRDIVWSADAQTGQLNYLSPSAAQVYGRSLEYFAENVGFWMDVIYPEDRALLQAGHESLMQQDYRDISYRILRPDGSIRRLHDRAWLVRDEQGRPLRLDGIAADITDRTWQELLQQRISELLEAVAESRALSQILEKLVHLVEEYTPGSRSSVLLLDQSTGTLHLGAAPSLPAEYNAAIEGLKIGPGVGSCGTAAYEKRPVIVEDIASHPYWEKFRALALPQGLHACWSHPILDQDESVLGTFAIYYGQTRAPEARELELISLAARIAGIAIRRHLAEAALRTSEEQYRSLVESADSSIAMFDAEGGLLYINEIGARAMGRPPEALLGQKMHTLFPQGIADYQFSTIRQVIASGEGVVHEAPSVVAGEERWYRTSVQPVRDGAGKVHAALINATDITRFKHAEQALREARVQLEQRVAERTAELERVKDRIEAIFNHSGDGILLLELDHGIQQANLTFEEMFGLSAQDYLGKGLDCCFQPEDQAHIDQAIMEVAATHRMQHIEARGKRAGGSYLEVEISIAPVNRSNRAVRSLVCIVRGVTERKQAERALRESEERLRTIVENIPVMLSFFDASGRFEFVNQHWLDQVGWTVEDLVAAEDPLALFYPDPDYRRSVLEYMLSAEPGWRAFHSQTKFRGERVTSWANVRLSDGRSIGIGQDITERTEAEQALRKYADEVHDLYNNAPCGYHSLDGDGMIIQMNDTELQWLGYTREEVLGKLHASAILSAEGFATFKANFPILMESGVRTGFEVDFKRKDGSLFPVLLNATAVYDDQGVFVQTRSTIFDITELKKAENALRESEQRFRTFIESAPVATLVTDRAGHIVLLNRETELLFGYSREELLGQSMEVLVPEEYRDQHGQHRQRYYEVEATRVRERLALSARRKTGEIFPVEIQLSHIEMKPSPLVMSFIIDVTRRREAEEALQEALAQEKDLGQLKSRFVSMASHEFRTPLATILASTETLSAYRDRMQPAEIAARLEKIRQQVNYMRLIMDDVLELARMQAGRVEYAPVPGDLDAFCRDLVEEFASQPEHQSRLSYRCDQTPLPAHFDPRLMRQVISNLIHNALKYSTPDKPVSVELRHGSAGIELAVIDQGIGIPPEEVKRLFEPFHRAGNVGSIRGTGLGLSIAKQATDLHGGTIQVFSEPGRGSTFIITLPAPSA